MKTIFKAAAASLTLLLAACAQAQSWSSNTIKIVVPYPPGGNVDNAARLIAPGLQQALGQPVIVENRAGAGGMIAAQHVAKSDPDGYTLFMAANGPLLYSPTIFGRNTYHWKKDFAPITSVSFTPVVLQVHPKVQAKTLGEFLDYAKKNPGKLMMASPGAGTTNHLVSEQLQVLTGARWTTVHYKGNAPATFDLIGGQVDFNFDQVSVALQYIKEGKTRALAISTPKRVASMPDVPTFAEAGVKGMEAATFTGLLAPAGTPKAIVDRLSQEVAKIVQDKNVIEKFEAMGAEARSMTPDEFAAYLAKEDATWLPIIKRIDIDAK